MIYKRGQLPSPSLADKRTFRDLDDDLLRYLNEQDENLISIFENGVSFDENIDGAIVQYTTTGGESSIPHGLGRIPTGYIVCRSSGICQVYDGPTSFTNQNIYLLATQPSVDITLFIF